jgi:hypothetical protein
MHPVPEMVCDGVRDGLFCNVNAVRSANVTEIQRLERRAVAHRYWRAERALAASSDHTLKVTCYRTCSRTCGLLQESFRELSEQKKKAAAALADLDQEVESAECNVSRDSQRNLRRLQVDTFQTKIHCSTIFEYFFDFFK